VFQTERKFTHTQKMLVHQDKFQMAVWTQKVC